VHIIFKVSDTCNDSSLKSKDNSFSLAYDTLTTTYEPTVRLEVSSDNDDVMNEMWIFINVTKIIYIKENYMF
jgi:hypothetical protein